MAPERRTAPQPHSRPRRAAVVLVLASVGLAALLDGVWALWTLATVLSESCGEDDAWLGLGLAGLLATGGASAGVVVVCRWFRSGRPPPSPERAGAALVVVMVVSLTLATVAGLWFPTGSCA